MAFLVIEGLDGSGKSTQIKLLREYLVKNSITFKYLHFPRTGSGIFGDLISKFLRGDLGKIEEVNPYLVALMYAADREDAKKEMDECISKEKLLLVDRYVMSNVAFQCAKVQTARERQKLKDWIFQLEFIKYGIPKPDINIFLDVPFDFTKEKLAGNRSGSERDYLMGKSDIHEADLDFQEKVRDVYLDQAEKEQTLRVVKCYDDKGMSEPGVIFGKILTMLKQYDIL